MNLRNKKVLLIGMGRTAVAAARLVLREGGQPRCTEQADGPLYESLKTELAELGIPFEVGGHTDGILEGVEVVIPSPGVSPKVPIVARAIESGAELMSELDLAFEYCDSKLIAVTGTNGKTTTTELIAAMIRACGHSLMVAGNNATPFSEAVMASPAPDYIVLEVSSYQLETSRRFRPWVGVLLNISEDHLERHGDLETYALAKGRLFANQCSGDYAVLNYDDPRVGCIRPGNDGVAVRHFSTCEKIDGGLWMDGDIIRHGGDELASVSSIQLPGRHNIENVLAALSVIRAGGFAWDKSLGALYRFKGVEHRIEPVATIDDVAYYNDSKSTNVDSLAVALKSFDCPIVLIAGGLAKSGDYGVLTELVSKRVTTLVTMGKDGPLLEASIGGSVSTRRALTMVDAVDEASKVARPGEVVLLSPGCASFDQYEDFEHRGRVFKECVLALNRDRSERVEACRNV